MYNFAIQQKPTQHWKSSILQQKLKKEKKLYRCGERRDQSRWRCSGSLGPRFVSDDYGTAELICSTAHARHLVTRSFALQGYMSSSHRKWRHLTAASQLCLLGQPLEERIQRAHCQASARRECCYGRCVSQERGCVRLRFCRYVCRDGCCASQEGRNVPAVPEASSPNLLAPAWPTLGSANSADGVSSNTSGTVNRMKGNTRGSGESREMHYFLRINIRHSF